MPSQDRERVTRLESNYMHQYDAYIEMRKRNRKRLIRRLTLFAIVAMLIVGSLGGYHLSQRSHHAEKQEQYEQLDGQLTSLKEEASEIEEEINLLQSEEYVLDIARTNYFFSKDGELIFQLPEEKPSY